MNMDNLQNLHLPPVYTRNNKKCYLDPIRKKLIYITPEETIRQNSTKNDYISDREIKCTNGYVNR